VLAVGVPVGVCSAAGGSDCAGATGWRGFSAADGGGVGTVAREGRGSAAACFEVVTDLEVADAGSGRVGRQQQHPPRLDQAGAGEFASVRLWAALVELVDLVVAPAVAEVPRGDVPQAVVVAVVRRLNDVDLVRRVLRRLRRDRRRGG
jgi:hypothetical protein